MPVLDLFIEMANKSTAPSTLKCIAFCFYHFEMWLWGLKLAAGRSLDLKHCFKSITQKLSSMESVDSLSLTPSDSLHLSECLILISKCSDMLDQAEARSALFHHTWTSPAPHDPLHSSTCGICMDDLDGSDVRVVCCPGSHAFHVGCIQDFLVFSSICSCQAVVFCPYCRFKLPNK